MNDSIKKFIKRHWILLWIILTGIALISSVTVYAAYTKTNKAKLVVARYGENGDLFSSNYLKSGVITNVPIHVKADATTAGDNVRISNFAQGNQAVPYDRTINYTLTMRLLYNNNGSYEPVTSENASTVIGTRYITASIGSNNYTFGYIAPSEEGADGTYSLNEVTVPSAATTLEGRVPSTNSIAIGFDPSQITELTTPSGLPRLYLEMIATPPTSYKDISTLQARLYLGLAGDDTTAYWEGYFNDEASAREAEPNAETETLVAKAYEGYNYVLEGVGEGTVTLSWNSNYLELNEGFIVDTLKVSVPLPDSNGIKSIAFTVDSTNKESRYDTQFYRSGSKEASDYSSWNKINSYVEFSFS